MVRESGWMVTSYVNNENWNAQLGACSTNVALLATSDKIPIDAIRQYSHKTRQPERHRERIHKEEFYN